MKSFEAAVQRARRPGKSTKAGHADAPHGQNRSIIYIKCILRKVTRPVGFYKTELANGLYIMTRAR